MPSVCPDCGDSYYGDLADHRTDGIHMTAVVPRLFVGGVWNANNQYELASNGVTTIVCMASELNGRRFVNSLRYKNFRLEDDVREFAMAALIGSTVFLHSVLQDGRSVVLVNCAFGRSRSVAAVMAYLMADERIDADTALNRLKRIRPSSQPNDGYMDQLRALAVLFRNLPIGHVGVIGEYLPPHGLAVDPAE